jgi:hypothetical protein
VGAVNECAPFSPSDLAELDHQILAPAGAVIPCREAFSGNLRSDTVVLRHDVDANEGSFQCAVDLARWEADRGYRSTYYMLHTAPYWMAKGFYHGVREIARLGHEIGIHADAVGFAVEFGGSPDEILRQALDELRRSGVVVTGVAAHGNALCRNGSRLLFVNDEQFLDCPRPEAGAPGRTVCGVALDPRPLASYGLAYAAERIPHGWRLSDSGGRWSVPFAEAANSLAEGDRGQLHFLMHPDHWTRAL